jgi:hypothetical protein
MNKPAIELSLLERRHCDRNCAEQLCRFHNIPTRGKRLVHERNRAFFVGFSASVPRISGFPGNSLANFAQYLNGRSLFERAFSLTSVKKKSAFQLRKGEKESDASSFSVQGKANEKI